MMRNKEAVFTINNYHQKVFGIVYYAGAKKSDKVIVFCNPFAEEEKETHLHLSNFARFLSDNGINTIRFHYRGTGDSFGEFKDYNLKTRVSDIEKVINYARSFFPQAEIGLFGVRLGATLASLIAEKNTFIKYLLLWEPVIKGKNVIRQLYNFRYEEEKWPQDRISRKIRDHFRTLKKTGCMDLYGFKMNKELVKDIEGIDLSNSDKRYKNKILIVQNSKSSLSQFSKGYKGVSKNIEFLKLKTQPYWKHFRYKLPFKLFQVTADWIKKN